MGTETMLLVTLTFPYLTENLLFYLAHLELESQLYCARLMAWLVDVLDRFTPGITEISVLVQIVCYGPIEETPQWCSSSTN